MQILLYSDGAMPLKRNPQSEYIECFNFSLMR